MGSFGGYGPSQGGSGGGGVDSSTDLEARSANVGTTTEATDQGDFAAGLTGGNEIVYDASGHSITAKGGSGFVIQGEDSISILADGDDNIIIGNNLNSGAGSGGDVTLAANDATSGSGGNVTVESGQTRDTSGGGASNGVATLAGTSARGGTNKAGGIARVRSGAGDGTGNGGLCDIVSGAGGATGDGGDIDITTGAGGSTSGNSGDINVDVGTVTSGTAGAINIGTSNASAINVGASGVTTTLTGVFDAPGIPRRLSVDLTTVGNVGGGEDDLMSYTLPAGTLAADGDEVLVHGWGDLAANSGSRTVKVFFGATELRSQAYGASFNNQPWSTFGGVHIFRTSSTTIEVHAGMSANTNGPTRANYTVSNLDSNSFEIKFTGEDSNSNTDEVQQYGMTVDLIRAP